MLAKIKNWWIAVVEYKIEISCVISASAAVLYTYVQSVAITGAVTQAVLIAQGSAAVSAFFVTLATASSGFFVSVAVGSVFGELIGNIVFQYLIAGIVYPSTGLFVASVVVFLSIVIGGTKCLKRF